MENKKITRGRPRLNIGLRAIVEAVYRHGQIVVAAKKLDCSPAYIHAALKSAGLSLHDVLGTDDSSLVDSEARHDDQVPQALFKDIDGARRR